MLFFSFTIPLITIVSPWLIRNYRLANQLLFQKETGLIYATYPGGHYQCIDIKNIINTDSKSKLQIEKDLNSLAFSRIISHPSIWLKNTFKNFSFRLWAMGFTDTHLRYFEYTEDTGGYHKHTSSSPLTRLFESNTLFSINNIHPLFHLYLIMNNIIGFSLIPLSIIGLILFPYLNYNNKIIFSTITYFWVITSFFSFTGSRLMIPMVPLIFLVIPNYLSAFKNLVKPFWPQTRKSNYKKPT